MKRIDIYYCGLGGNQLSKQAISRLGEICADSDCSLNTSFFEVTKEQQKEILIFSAGTDLSPYQYLSNKGVVPSDDTTYWRLLLLVDADSDYSKWGLGRGYCWGYSDGLISVDYSPPVSSSANQLHEILHLLGVQDCYDEKTQKVLTQCRNNDCVMRYGNSSMGFCEAARKELKDFYKNLL